MNLLLLTGNLRRCHQVIWSYNQSNHEYQDLLDPKLLHWMWTRYATTTITVWKSDWLLIDWLIDILTNWYTDILIREISSPCWMILWSSARRLLWLDNAQGSRARRYSHNWHLHFYLTMWTVVLGTLWELQHARQLSSLTHGHIPRWQILVVSERLESSIWWQIRSKQESMEVMADVW